MQVEFYVAFLLLKAVCLSETLICTSTADACLREEPSNLNLRMLALEERVRQMQKLISKTNSQTFTTINGVPRGKYSSRVPLYFMYLIFNRK